MIILAPFYKDILPANEGSEVQEMSKIFDYKQNLTRFYNSFQKENSHNKFVVCTDTKTNLQFKNIFRSKVDGLNLMESFCISNLDFVKQHDAKIVLCGADHLVNGKLDNLFLEDDFDIGLAIALKPPRINNTIVLVNNLKRKETIEFFERRLQEFYNLSKEEKIWYGDQMSYQKIVEKENIFAPDGFKIYSYGNLRIKFFPYGGPYVRGFKKTALPVKGDPVIIDFKGISRKQRAEEIYNYIMK